MAQLMNYEMNRRNFLQAAGIGVVAVGGVSFLSSCSGDAGKNGLKELSIQANFLVNAAQLGEVTALAKGFYEEQGLALSIVQGGPNVDPTANVVGGHTNLGIANSSKDLILGVAEGRPLKAFAAVAQRHPYAYFSLPDNPVRKPEDLMGKRVGVNQSGVVLLDAVLAKHDIPRDSLEVITIAGDVTPILTGQVDVWTGWVTQQGALGQLPADYVTMSLWDAGVQMYGLNYMALADTIAKETDTFDAFLKASARGWKYAKENPDEAAELLVASYTDLKLEDEKVAAGKILEFVFPEGTNSFGEMDREHWQEQIKTWDDLGMIPGKNPEVDDVMTLDLLDATSSDRALS